MNQYSTTDGRILLSPASLTYALTDQGKIEVGKISSKHKAVVTIIADAALASVIRETGCCAVVGGKVCIDNDGYTPLAKFLSTATTAEKDTAMTQLAAQMIAMRDVIFSHLSASKKLVASTPILQITEAPFFPHCS